MRLRKTTAGRRWRVLGTLAAAVALMASLGTTNALAATRPSAAEACPVTYFGYTGEEACGTFALYVPAGRVANNGGEEAFVIGTDWAVWHAWPGSNGWHSLGGQARHLGGNGVDLFDADPFVVTVIGTDNRPWCDAWGVPAWSGWGLCAFTT